jgi:hypothetical protein
MVGSLHRFQVWGNSLDEEDEPYIYGIGNRNKSLAAEWAAGTLWDNLCRSHQAQDLLWRLPRLRCFPGRHDSNMEMAARKFDSPPAASTAQSTSQSTSPFVSNVKRPSSNFRFSNSSQIEPMDKQRAGRLPWAPLFSLISDGKIETVFDVTFVLALDPSCQQDCREGRIFITEYYTGLSKKFPVLLLDHTLSRRSYRRRGRNHLARGRRVAGPRRSPGEIPGTSWHLGKCLVTRT